MVEPEDIGRSVLAALILSAIAGAFWPYIPKTGTFGSLSLGLKGVLAFLIGAVVVGAAQVGLSLLSEF